VKVRLPTNVRIRIPLDRATETTLVELRDLIASAPGPARLMLNVEQRGEYCVVMEPEGMTVAADRAFVDKAELLLGRGTVQALD
jgi:DNA polymerase III subunit alpha